VTSGHMMVDVADLPDGGMFFSKPYEASKIISSFRQLMAT